MMQSAYASEQEKSVWTVWKRNTEAEKNTYRTKAKISSALLTARDKWKIVHNSENAVRYSGFINLVVILSFTTAHGTITEFW